MTPLDVNGAEVLNTIVIMSVIAGAVIVAIVVSTVILKVLIPWLQKKAGLTK